MARWVRARRGETRGLVSDCTGLFVPVEVEIETRLRVGEGAGAGAEDTYYAPHFFDTLIDNFGKGMAR